MTALLGIVNLFVSVLLVPFSSAATNIGYALPQTTNYKEWAAAEITDNQFSTDLKGRVGSAFQCSEQGEPQIEVLIINKEWCIKAGQTTTYKVLVTNTGDAAAYNLELIFTAPRGMVIVNQVTPTYRVFNVGQTAEFDFTATAQESIRPAVATAEARYYDCAGYKQHLDCVEQCRNNGGEPAVCETQCDFSQSTITTHTIDNDCAIPNMSPYPKPSGQPAIICGPGDVTCQASMPNLGVNFKSAKSWQDNPDLGRRFEEAIADIIPGECRVLPDDVIIQPDYHDALNRQARPAAPFMRPLYNSGQDFVQLVHENELLGIKNKIYAKEQLSRIHSIFWQKLGDKVSQVISNQTSTASVRSSVSSLVNEFIQETRQAQQELTQKYQQMQQQRAQKFDPVAQRAIQNAGQSIMAACGPPPGDGGLEQLLPAVKQAYEVNLQQRAQVYQQTQANYANPAGAPGLGAEYRPDVWQNALTTALNAFDGGNPQLLRDFMNRYVGQENAGFEAQWSVTYDEQARQDKEADRQIRLQNWEVALDQPKTIATNCQKEKDFAAPVEQTWCESDDYDEFVIRGAPKPVRDARPIEGIPSIGEKVLDSAVIGNDSCINPGPGDPYWAGNCACHCDEIVDCPTPDGGSELKLCQSCYPITRHDIYITSQAECFLDAAMHLTEPPPQF
ncbi:MAG: hypothetical protein Q8P73_02360 [bacterium]|nr:hypothetical protein [bacterium]